MCTLCLTSFSLHVLRFIHVIVCIIGSFLLIAMWYSTVWRHHSLFIHSPVGRCLSCFHYLAIMNNTSMHIPVLDFLWPLLIFLLSIYLGVELWGKGSCFSPGWFCFLAGITGECRIPLHQCSGILQDRRPVQPCGTKTQLMGFPSLQMSDVLLYTYPQKDGKYRLKNTLAVASMKVSA